MKIKSKFIDAKIVDDKSKESNKAKKITKHILYKFGVPVLKIKENK